MRQIRIAASGDNMASSIALLNRAIAELYPGEPPTAVGPVRSVPRPVTGSYLKNVELGHHSRIKQPTWLRDSGLERDNSAHASRVPGWLVRAYDVAFGADGYLVDVYLWAVKLQADNEHNPPRRTGAVPRDVAPGGELACLMAGFEEAPTDVVAVLVEHAATVQNRRQESPGAQEWLPSSQDGSGSYGIGEENVPEGLPVAPGSYLLPLWELHNTGTVSWKDRYLYPAHDMESGVHAPPFVPLPDTPPGGRATVCVPVRAPRRPGTYRACLKSGWPDGVYCFPNTLLGLIVSLIVPPADMIGVDVHWGSE